MGGDLSMQQRLHAKELQKIINNHYFITRRKIAPVSLGDLEKLISEIACRCPWYSGTLNTLNTQEWISIGNCLHTAPRAPIKQRLIWQNCTEAIEHIEKKSLKTAVSNHVLLEAGRLNQNTLPPPYLQNPSEPANSLYPQLPIPTPKAQAIHTSPPSLENQLLSTIKLQPGLGGAISIEFQQKPQKENFTGEELLEGLQAFPITENNHEQRGTENEIEHLGTHTHMAPVASSASTSEKRPQEIENTEVRKTSLPPSCLQPLSPTTNSLYTHLPLPETVINSASPICPGNLPSQTTAPGNNLCAVVSMGFHLEHGNLTREELLKGIQASPIRKGIKELGVAAIELSAARSAMSSGYAPRSSKKSAYKTLGQAAALLRYKQRKYQYEKKDLIRLLRYKQRKYHYEKKKWFLLLKE